MLKMGWVQILLLACCASVFSARVTHAQSFVSNRLVARQPNKFFGWPANSGAWVWGNEILVGFDRCVYASPPPDSHHRVGGTCEPMQARSTDGGVNWQLENFVSELPQTPVTFHDFTHHQFGFRVWRENYWYTYTRGRIWKGPYPMSIGGSDELRGRTDYIVVSPTEMHVFQSASRAGVFGERAVAMKTTDGGQTFNFSGWMTPAPAWTGAPCNSDKNYTIMPATVRIPGLHAFLSVVRRRICQNVWDNEDQEWKAVTTRLSNDLIGSANGSSWASSIRLADNENTPATLSRLADGRLVYVYVARRNSEDCEIENDVACSQVRYRIGDLNNNWGPDVVLRDNGLGWDLGYPRTVVVGQPPNEQLVTMYYWSTQANPQQHIEATIWRP